MSEREAARANEDVALLPTSHANPLSPRCRHSGPARAELVTAPGFFDFASEVCVLGGIMVNRGKGGDRFVPLMFQSRKQAEGTVEDLYTETFGPRPDIETALNGAISNGEIYNKKLEL